MRNLQSVFTCRVPRPAGSTGPGFHLVVLRAYTWLGSSAPLASLPTGLDSPTLLVAITRQAAPLNEWDNWYAEVLVMLGLKFASSDLRGLRSLSHYHSLTWLLFEIQFFPFLVIPSQLKKDTRKVRSDVTEAVEVQQAFSSQLWVWLHHCREQLKATGSHAGTVTEL